MRRNRLFRRPPLAALLAIGLGFASTSQCPARAGAGDAVITFCRTAPDGCACSYEGIETLLGPAEQASLLRDLLRGDAVTTVELAAFGAQREAACSPAAAISSDPDLPLSGAVRSSGSMGRHRHGAIVP